MLRVPIFFSFSLSLSFDVTLFEFSRSLFILISYFVLDFKSTLFIFEMIREISSNLPTKTQVSLQYRDFCGEEMYN